MRGRTVLVGVCAVLYLVACQLLMTRAPTSPWGAVVVVGPMLVLLGTQAWQRRQRTAAAVCALGLAGLVVQGWRGGGLAPTLLYLMEHVATHLGLALLFALTLRPGQVPLITGLAYRVHGSLTPDMQAYSRRVTVAWSLYFVAMAATSIAVFLAAPFDVWATFANFGTPLGVALLFVGEYLLRYRLHPEFERATLRAAMNAYSRRDASP